VFSTDHPQETYATEEPPVAEVPAEASSPEPNALKDILVRQGDQTYSAGDMATVQRWIVERRLSRDGFLSLDSATWTPLSEMPDLAPFLDLVEKVKSMESPVLTHGETPEEAADAEHESTLEAKFVDVAELEATVGVEPENTADELDIDPFPTEEVPLPPTPIVTNLKELEAQSFQAPDTEEVPFDFPQNDDHTLDAPKIDLPSEPSLPTLSHAQDMVDAPGPTFAEDEHPDFPTEEELMMLGEDDLESEDHDQDPLGNQLFASVESEWDTGEEDDDLAWVTDKKRTRRIVVGMLLLVLIGLTAKLIMDRRADRSEGPILAQVGEQELPEGATEAPEALDAADAASPEDTTPSPEAEKEAVEETPPPKTESKPKDPPPARQAAPAPSTDDGAQDRRAATARQAKAKRGPQPKTAADFVDRGRQAISEGDYNTARVHYLEAVFMEPQNATANQGLAFAALKQGDAPFAIEYFCKALKSSAPTSSVAQETRQALSDLNAECP